VTPLRPAAAPLAILLVEDNAVNQAVVLLSLKRLGHSADIANNGREALAVLEQRDYDVLLMDVQMPELDGIETTRRLRARRRAQPYIIAMTAGALAEDQAACLAVGMNEVITKPFQLAELARALSRCVEHRAVKRVVDPEAPLGAVELEEVRALTGGDPQALAELAHAQLATMERLIGELQSALVVHDVEALRRILHSLAGSTGFFGERRLAAQIEVLASAVRQDQRAELPVLFTALQAEYRRVREALRRLAEPTR
jgi:CheY-like chemotaxis protein